MKESAQRYDQSVLEQAIHGNKERDRFGAGAFALYVTLSILWFGHALVGDFFTSFLGRGSDPSVFAWDLVWWPFALARRLNPFLCRLIWAPGGVNLAWNTGIPLASIIAAPLTAWLGPVATFNALVLMAPALAAWSAFLLCRYVSGSDLSAMVAGYLFGFSPYMLAQIAGGHLVLLFIFPAPLAVLLTLLALEGKIGKALYAVTLASTIVAQFLLSVELATSLVLSGLGVTVLVLLFAPKAQRASIVALAAPLAWSGLITAAILSPYLYYLLAGAPRDQVNSPGTNSADLLNFMIPTAVNAVGLLPQFETIAARFPAWLGEQSAFIGPVLIILVILYARSNWQYWYARMLSIVFGLFCIAALGPSLHVIGWKGPWMPWAPFLLVPLLKNILPVRLMSYAFLSAAVIGSLWLANETSSRFEKVVFVTALILLWLPNPNPNFWTTAVDTPPFFTNSDFSKYLTPGENVIILPYGSMGMSMAWQAQTEMYFRMAGGYTSVQPGEFQVSRTVDSLYTGRLIPDEANQLKAFMSAHDSDAILVADCVRLLWKRPLAALDPAPISLDGVTIYRINKGKAEVRR